MAAPINKQRLLSQLFSALPQHMEVPAEGNGKTENRPVLEQFIFAICREGTSRCAAEKAFRSLREGFFDWNEVRVSSVREIAEILQGVPQAEVRAQRIIAFLQEVFETTFSFDLEGLQKKGLKIAAKQLSRYEAANDYSVAFVVQQSLGGHALPLDKPSLRVLTRLGLIDGDDSDQEATRASLEHQVPKAKGSLFTDLISVLAEDCCWSEEPQCSRCPLASSCPTAKEIKTGVVAESAARSK
jgi:endonuclease-3